MAVGLRACYMVGADAVVRTVDVRMPVLATCREASERMRQVADGGAEVLPRNRDSGLPNGASPLVVWRGAGSVLWGAVLEPA